MRHAAAGQATALPAIVLGLSFYFVGHAGKPLAGEGTIPLSIATAHGRTVYVAADPIGCRWRLRIPERVLADPSELLVDHSGVPLQWARESHGGVHGRSTAREKSAVAIDVKLIPTTWGLAIRMQIQNRTHRRLRHVVAHVCLSHDHAPQQSIRFRDPDGRRTYFVGGDGLVCLGERVRGLRHHWLVAGERPIGFFSNAKRPEWRFWGRGLAKLTAREPWLCGMDRSRRWAVATFWDRAAELFQNGDEPNRCIHVDPVFGDLQPKQAVVRLGGIVVVRGGPDEALLVYRRWRKTVVRSATGALQGR